MRERKCKWCGDKYTPISSFQKVCKPTCAIEYNKDQDKKAIRKKTREWREKNKSKGQWMSEAQAAFNKYVRARDLKLPCISCGMIYKNGNHLVNGGSRWDAGHYRSRGAAAHLRFHLDNVHKQCVKCNRNMSGNSVEYRKRLIARIGLERVERIENDYTIKKFSVDYLKRIKKIFNKKARMVHGRAK
jgi:hypothetical protein